MMHSMTLSDWIKAERGRGYALARAIGAHPVCALQWAAGRPVPIRYMAAIELFTRGEVTRQELCPDEWQKIWPELVSRRRSEQRRALGMAA